MIFTQYKLWIAKILVILNALIFKLNIKQYRGVKHLLLYMSKAGCLHAATYASLRQRCKAKTRRFLPFREYCWIVQFAEKRGLRKFNTVFWKPVLLNYIQINFIR